MLLSVARGGVRVAPAVLVLALLAAPASLFAAGRRARPLFEPTDLELEDAGTLEVDLQMGFVKGRDAARLVIPDLELDVGLMRNLELDLDGAYAIEGPQMGPFSFDHAAPDSLWAAVKVGLLSVDGDRDGIGLGIQIGPKLPVAPGSRGLGVESLALIGLRHGRAHLVLDLGAFVDPRPSPGDSRPLGLEGGVDLDLDLDIAGHWSLTAELGGVRFFSSDPHQLVATAGVAWAVTERLEISLVGLAGILAGGDRFGVLVGVSPKIVAGPGK